MSDATERLSGEWTIHHIGELHAPLLALVNSGCSAFDASAIHEIDSAGLQLLVSARNALMLQGQELVLREPSGCVKDVLACYGLDANLHPTDHEVCA